MKYRINYGTGAGDETVNGTLEQAMKVADDGAAYTQRDIRIEDENSDLVALRHWWGVKYDPDESDETDIIGFGDFGYYGEWTVV